MDTRAGSFVGRWAELDTVIGALGRDEGDRGTATVCIVGPAGIGKTRLVLEAEQRFAESGPDFVWTRCWDGPGTPALWPWTQLLDQLGLATATDDIGRDRLAYFDRIESGLRARAGERPLVLVIDDLHWADPASLELLGFIARSPRPSRLSVIVTYREPEVSAGGIAQQIARIEREATVLPLDGLTVEQVGELASSMRPAELPHSVLVQLHERTGGNPFFVGELLHTLGDESGGAGVPVTAGLRFAVEGHLDLVDTECRRMLEVAAVQGRVFDHRVVAAAAHLDEFEVTELLQRAVERGIAVPVDGTIWQFDHALLGEVLLAGQGAHDIALHHSRTADGLEKLHGAEHAAYLESVANHLFAAGSLTPPDRLLDAALAAARHAGRRLAWEDQSHHLATAIHALRSLGAPDLEQLVAVLVERCEVEKQRRRLDVARDLALEAADLARRIDDPTVLARVALAFPPGTEAIEIDDIHDPAQRPLREEALAAIVAAGGHDALRAALQSALALSLYWETPTGDRAESHALSAARRDELTADAVATARRLGDDRALAAALDARICANWGPAMRAARPALAEELVATALRLGDAHLALSGRVWRVVELLETGRIDEADREIDAFEREALRIRSRLHLWTVARWRANRAFMAGDLPAAEALAANALALGTEIMPDEVAFHFYTTTLGPIQYLRGELEASFDYVRATAEAAPNVPAWRVGLVTIAAETGRHDLARREFRVLAEDDFAMLPRDLNFLGSMMMCALVAHDLADADAAARVYDHLAPHGGRLALHGTGYASYGAVDLALGQCAHVSGRPDAARAHYESAIEQCAALGSPYAAIARLHLGRLLAATQPASAEHHLVAAEHDLRRAGLVVMAERAVVAREQVTARATVQLVAVDGGWWVGRDGHGVTLPDLKGFRALHELVRHPDRHLHALELAAAIEGHRAPVVDAASRQPVLDARARREYARHVADLRERLDRTDARGDAVESERLATELQQVLEALAEAEGFGGRPGSLRTDADRARVNVTKHVRRAIDRIAEVDSDVGDHLRRHVTTGMHCAYHPGSSGFHWEVS